MFDVFYSGTKPDRFAGERAAKSIDEAATLSRTKFFWYIYGNADYTEFNFDFVPPPWEETHIHVFGSQWQRDGGICLANKHTVQDRVWHWRAECQVIRLEDRTNWGVPSNIDETTVDFSWHPDPHDPPYIYHFPSQWQSASGVTYTVPGACRVKLVSPFVVKAEPILDHWTVPEEIDEASIDFSWHPNVLDPEFVYHFPSEWQQSSGLTYTVPGANDVKLMDETPMLGCQMTKVLDVFFVDRNNQQASSRFEKLKEKYPNIQKVRFMNSMMETVRRCVTRSKTTRFWVISSLNVYDGFDFSWQPESWQRHMTHVFGSQWNKWSDTFLLSKWEFERNSKCTTGMSEFPNLNFVQDQKVRAPDDSSNIHYVDWGNADSTIQLEQLKAKHPNIKVTRFVDNYLDTFKRIMSVATTEHVWIINSICDYSKFDFSWQPGPWQSEMIHVFPTGFEKRGDTFYINVEMFKNQMVDLDLLDWFNVINYCSDQQVNRLPVPHCYYDGDDLVSAIKTYQFDYPFAVFSPYHGHITSPDMCLWSKKDRVADRFNASGSVSVIPRDAKSEICTQIYDYPYVNTQDLDYMRDDLLDIIYISNGEPDADKWYNHLLDVLAQEESYGPYLKYDNRIRRIDRVSGRLASARAAANASNTPWFFVVTGKLEVERDFDWTWQPDYWQGPKHYIFNATNPVNRLCYGHQAVVAWNKNLILNTTHPGLDLTMSQPHEHIPILSGTARFNSDPWTTWRTAFREVVKLRLFTETQPTLETSSRLATWLNAAEGENSKWCLQGATDAIEYYDSVGGGYTELMRSFEWDWLHTYFKQRYH